MGEIKKGVGPKIVAIGGGTGLSTILRGFKRVTDHLTAIVTVADDGGGTGMLREELGMLAPGDIRSCISALADEEGVMQELLKYRFTDGRLAGQNMGNLLIAALNGIYGNFEEAVEKANDILKVKGRVIPVTGNNVTLMARLKDGTVVRGESQIPQEVLRLQSPVETMYLEPENVSAAQRAVQAIYEAEVILIGPGSLYTSIIPNFLVAGIRQAIKQSNALKIFLCNIMTQPGETDNFTVLQHVEEIHHYIGEEVIEYVIANDKVMSEEVIALYVEDGAKQVIPQREERKILEEKDITLIANAFAQIQGGYVRHDAERIASIVLGLIAGLE